MESIPENKQRFYFNQFRERNKERLKEQIECPICFGTYTYFNKTKHHKSKRHMRMVERQKKIEESKLLSIDLSTHLYGSA